MMKKLIIGFAAVGGWQRVDGQAATPGAAMRGCCEQSRAPDRERSEPVATA